jgi:hypothetical protein
MGILPSAANGSDLDTGYFKYATQRHWSLKGEIMNHEERIAHDRGWRSGCLFSVVIFLMIVVVLYLTWR